MSIGAGRFDGKVGIVVGAAGGIGAATVGAFAGEGAHVLMIDVDDVTGNELRKKLQADGLSAEYHHCDVTRGDDVADLFAAVAAAHPRLDFATNLVGGSAKPDARGVELHEQSEAGWDASITLTLKTALLCMKHELGAMLRGGGGAIVNVASMAGVHVTFNATAAYSASKAGMLHLTKYAAVQYADRGIRVNAVAPGLTATPHAVAAVGMDAIQKEIGANQVIPRPSTPEDQANAIAWLCSDAAAMVTGHMIPVDGGWNAR